MGLDEILERNRRFTHGRAPLPLPDLERYPLTVLGCFDPRLDPLLLPALGLEPDRVFLFRAAGAYVAAESATLRSLMVAVLMLESKELAVVGHTSCKMAHFDSSAFIDAFRARGVHRDAFGSQNIRDWAGATPSPRRGVELSVQHILSEPACPRDLTVYGVLLDDTTGALETVVEPGGVIEDSATDGPEASDTGNDETPQESDTREDMAAPLAADEPGVDDALEDVVEELARAIGASDKWRGDAVRLRQELAAAPTSAAMISLLSHFVERAGPDATDIVKAFGRLTRAARPTGSRDSETLSRLLRHLVAKL